MVRQWKKQNFDILLNSIFICKADKSVHQEHDKATNSGSQDDQLPALTTTSESIHDTPDPDSTHGKLAEKASDDLQNDLTNENGIPVTDHTQKIMTESLANDAAQHSVQEASAVLKNE